MEMMRFEFDYPTMPLGFANTSFAVGLKAGHAKRHPARACPFGYYNHTTTKAHQSARMCAREKRRP